MTSTQSMILIDHPMCHLSCVRIYHMIYRTGNYVMHCRSILLTGLVGITRIVYQNAPAASRRDRTYLFHDV